MTEVLTRIAVKNRRAPALDRCAYDLRGIRESTREGQMQRANVRMLFRPRAVVS